MIKALLLLFMVACSLASYLDSSEHDFRWLILGGFVGVLYLVVNA